MSFFICAGRAPRRVEPGASSLATDLEVARALRASPYVSVRRVRCHLTSGIARLEGRLPTFHLKQAAQEAVRNVDGVKAVDNRIVVGGFR